MVVDKRKDVTQDPDTTNNIPTMSFEAIKSEPTTPRSRDSIDDEIYNLFAKDPVKSPRKSDDFKEEIAKLRVDPPPINIDWDVEPTPPLEGLRRRKGRKILSFLEVAAKESSPKMSTLIRATSMDRMCLPRANSVSADEPREWPKLNVEGHPLPRYSEHYPTRLARNQAKRARRKERKNKEETEAAAAAAVDDFAKYFTRGEDGMLFIDFDKVPPGDEFVKLLTLINDMLTASGVSYEKGKGFYMLPRGEDSPKLEGEFEPQMFSSLMPTLPEIPPVTLKVSDDTKEFLSSFMDQFSQKASDVVSQAKVDVNFPQIDTDSFVSGIKNKMSSFLGHPITISVMCLLASIAVYTLVGKYVTTNPIVKTLAVAVSTVSAFYLCPELQGYLNQIREFFTLDVVGDMDVFEAQANEVLDKKVVAQGLVKPLLSFLYFVVYAKPCKTDFLEDFVSRAQGLEKLSKGFEFAVEFASTMCWDFLNAIGHLTGIERLKHSNSHFPQIAELTAEVEQIMHSFRMGADYNYDNAMVLLDLEKKITKLLTSIPYAKKYDGDRNAANMLLKVLSPFISKMSRSNYTGNGPRRVPLGICLYGNTGVGKSLCVTPLINDVLARVLEPAKILSFLRNHDDFVHAVDPNSDFWNGYHGQFVAMLDEAGHRFDGVGNPDPGCEMILRMINMVNYPLDMAHLDDKGNVNFRSQLVFLTTNRKKWDWKSMILPEAYARRFKVNYLQCPKVEWSTPDSLVTGVEWDRKLDLTRVKPNEDGDFDLTVYDFYPWDSLAGKVIGPAVTYDELVVECVQKFQKGAKEGEQLLKFHQKRKFAAFESVRGRFSADILLEADKIMKPQADDDVIDDALLREQLVKELGEECYAMVERYHLELCISKPTLADMVRKKVIRLRDTSREVWSKFVEMHIQPLCPFISSVCESITSFIYNHPLIAAATAGLSAFCFAWPFMRKVFETQSGDVKITKSSKKNAKKVAKARSLKSLKSSKTIAAVAPKPVVAPVVTPQGLAINENTDAMATKLYRYSMWNVGIVGETYGMAVCFGARLFQVPRHYYCYFEEKYEQYPDLQISFSRVGSADSSFTVNYSDLREMFFDTQRNTLIRERAELMGDESPKYADEIYIIMNKTLPSQKSIVKFLPRASDRLLGGPVMGGLVRPFTDGPGFRLHACRIVPSGLLDYTAYSNPDTYSYTISTVKGECGALLIRCDDRDATPVLLGQHIGGNGTVGASIPFSREVIEEAMMMASQVAFEDFDLDESPPAKLGEERPFETQGYALEGQFIEVCEGEQLRQPTTTSIRKSPLHGAWGESLYAPALLRKVDDGPDPHIKARANYSGHFAALDEQKVAGATSAYINAIFKASDKPEPKILSPAEAIAGDGELKGIPRATSLGYPFCNDSKDRGKTGYFGADGEYKLDTPKALALLDRLEFLIGEMKQGKRSKFVYADFLKDERLKKTKVAEGRSRLVSASPVDLLALQRMYFGSFVAWMSRNRIHNGVALGVNPYGVEWQIIKDHLQSVGTSCIFGDYSRYDGSLSPRIMYACLEVIESFYTNSTEEERRIRAILFEDVVNSRHIMTTESDDGGTVGLIYEWFGSNPSGNFLTTVLNSVCNNILLRYAIKVASESAAVNVTFQDIEENCRFITFGDDNGLSLSDSFKHVTQSNLTAAFETIGLTYTDEDKLGVMFDHRDVTSCSFLKRGWRWEPVLGRWVAPLSLVTILEMPYWTKKSASPTDLFSTVQLSLLELSLHGQEVFNAWAPLILRASRELAGYSPVFSTWRACLNEACSLEGEY